MVRIIFGIPLRSRRSSLNWSQVTKLLDMTLRSVLQQHGEHDFGVILACHEVPDLAVIHDPRVTVAKATFPPPASFSEQMVDEGRKRRLIGSTMRALGGGYLMMVDADDLVSNRIASFVCSDAGPHGYILKNGYEFYSETGRVRVAPQFDKLCGTSAIVRFDVADLPTSVEDATPCYYTTFSNHTWYESNASAQGRPLRPLPFPGATYVTNHGENHSVQAGNIGWKRQLFRVFVRGGKPSAAMQSEFGLDLAAFGQAGAAA